MKFMILMAAIGLLSINTCAIAQGGSHDDSGYHVYGIGHSHNSGLNGFDSSVPGFGTLVPSDGTGPNTRSTNESGYTPDNGTYATPSNPSMPDNSMDNNWTTTGNYNPHAGTTDTKKSNSYGN